MVSSIFVVHIKVNKYATGLHISSVVPVPAILYPYVQCCCIHHTTPHHTTPHTSQVRRGLLRHRKLHSKAIFGITDDKKHDSYAAQWFMRATLELIRLAYVLPGIERFFAIHVHSDNAGSHFKSSKTMFFLTTLLAICGSWPAAAVTGAAAMSVRAFWEFGAPGHGKGVWDGLGALIKRAVRQDIIDGVVLTASGRITTAAEVAEHVCARFSTEEWKASHAASTINEIIVIHGSTGEIHGTRPQPDHE